MKAHFRNISSIFLCSIVLLLQGGFYTIHEHSLEVEAHHCAHDGEHDFSISEDCEVCEIHAKQSFLSDFNPEFEEDQELNTHFLFPENSEFENERLVQYLRGPPLMA